MLESELTMYQLLSEFEQREYLTRIINILNSDKDICKTFDKVVNKIEEQLKNKNIPLPELFPFKDENIDYVKIESVS